jgi:hypothetical protein
MQEEATDFDPLSEWWRHERASRTSWVSGTDRDAAAGQADRDADERDDAAAERDREAAELDAEALSHEQSTADLAVAAAIRLAQADRRDAERWAEAIRDAEAARHQAETTRADHDLRALERAEATLEARTTDLVQAGLDRDTTRGDLQHVAQELQAAATVRRRAAEDRHAAEADRRAAGRDRDAARSARQQASIDRAEE